MLGSLISQYVGNLNKCPNVFVVKFYEFDYNSRFMAEAKNGVLHLGKLMRHPTKYGVCNTRGFYYPNGNDVMFVPWNSRNHLQSRLAFTCCSVHEAKRDVELSMLRNKLLNMLDLIHTTGLYLENKVEYGDSRIHTGGA